LQRGPTRGALLSAAVVSRAEAARFATAKEQRAFTSEAIYHLRILARSGTAQFSPGLKVVVQPACVSTVDPAFALVTIFEVATGRRFESQASSAWVGSAAVRLEGSARCFSQTGWGRGREVCLWLHSATRAWPRNVFPKVLKSSAA